MIPPGSFWVICSAGRTLMFAGRFAPSRSHLEAGLAANQIAGLYRPDPQIQGCLGIVLFCLGFPDQALAHSNAAIADARRLNASAVFSSELVDRHQCFRSSAITRPWTSGQTSSLRWRRSRVSPPFVAQGTVYLGWAKVKKGNVAEGISLLRSGLTAYHETGAEA